MWRGSCSCDMVRITCTSSQCKNNYFAEMWSGSEAGSYLRLLYHSTLGLRVIQKKAAREAVQLAVHREP